MNQCLQAFSKFADQVSKEEILQKAISQASKKYILKPYDIQFTEEQAKEMFENIQKKFYRKQTLGESMNWFENQLRIFVWTLVCYLYLEKINIQQMKQDNWALFSRFFPHKNSKLFDYQCHSIYLSPCKNHLWVQNEDISLTQIIENKKEKIKWNQISKELFEISNKKYFRTPKQCRQRWNNHLDPNKKKGHWKIPQCLKMFEFVRENGKKWALMVKALDYTRNQHSIKNKFNSLFRKQQKMVPNCTEEQIYDIIIKRLKTALDNRQNSKNEEASYDINDIEDQVYGGAVPKPQIQYEPEFMFGHQVQRSNPNNYGQILRKKLMSFSTKPTKQIVTQTSLQKKQFQQIKQQNNADRLYANFRSFTKQDQLPNDSFNQQQELSQNAQDSLNDQNMRLNLDSQQL